MLGFAALSMWPDLDAVGFEMGVPYGAPFGHRGATHSFLAAVVVAGLVAAFGKRRWRLFVFCLAVAASHPLLDTLTDGGLGIALFWPFTDRRYFLPDALRVIPVAPIGARMLSLRGLYVTLVELAEFSPLWIWSLIPRIGG